MELRDNFISQFDERLGLNFERLIGTRRGIAGLPLNLATIGCIVLLVEREQLLEKGPPEARQRYTRETLYSDAAEAGVPSDGYLNAAIRALIEKGYAGATDDGMLLVLKPALSMARLLNLVFPKMQGINFLAYAGQALDEVMTSRTDSGSALDRFDQTLKMHGVSRKQGAGSAARRKKDTTESGDVDPQNTALGREMLLRKLRERAEATREPQNEAPAPAMKPTAISIDAVPRPPDGDIAMRREPGRPEADQSPEAGPSDAPEPAPSHEESIPPAGLAVQRPPETWFQQSFEDDQTASSEADARDSSRDEGPPLPDGTGADEGVAAELDEEAIGKRVAAFEQRLSLTCPLCKERELIERCTASGKTFYVCPDEICGFISWGRPHHIECPRCRNPFMIEAASASGETILKCPRATCQYSRDVEKRRRVVRRRVVRKK